MDRAICNWCNANVNATAAYCQVCGENLVTAGREIEMHYKMIKVNENGKALICPHCENEELTLGDYCKICGNDIINTCADMPDPKAKNLVIKGCKSILQGNARYCSKCGNEGTFFQKGWLTDWISENVKKAIRNVNGKDNAIKFSDIHDEKAK